MNMEKDYGEKWSELRKAAELEPSNAAYHISLGITLYAERRYEEAKKEVQKVAELQSSSW